MCHNDDMFHELRPPMSLLQAHTILIMAELSKNCRRFALIECRLQSTSLIFRLVTELSETANTFSRNVLVAPA